MWALDDRSEMDADSRRALERALTPLTSLQAVLAWSFARTPPADVAEVIVQDEFSHDVVLAWEGPRWLVFDTT